MQLFKKSEPQKKNTANSRLVKKLTGRDSGRRVFGFACSPDIPARLKMLAAKLHVPLFSLTEHTLQLGVGVITKALEDLEETNLLRDHLIEVHVQARTIEKLGAYDREMADRLDKERQRRLEIEGATRQLVMDFVRRGIKPLDIAYFADYGIRCKAAINRGQPVPKD